MTKTIRVILIMISLSISTSLLGQNKPLRNDTISADSDMQVVMSTKVSMDIDMKLFPKTQGSMFFSESPRAMIMPMVLRGNFDTYDEKKLLEETGKELGIEIKKQGALTKQGKKAYYIIGITKDKDRNVILEIYFVKGDVNRTIMITGFYDKSAKKLYGKQIRNAAFSAKLD